MSDSHRVLWLRTFLAKHYYNWVAWQLLVDPSFVQCLPRPGWSFAGQFALSLSKSWCNACLSQGGCLWCAVVASFVHNFLSSGLCSGFTLLLCRWHDPAFFTYTNI
jgi:hypothetical protein